MAKTLPPGEIKIPGIRTPFSLNAVPDIFDERDLEYRPRLEPLPPSIDRRDQDKAFYVLQQAGNSCTGHAVAGVVNTIMARQARQRQKAAGQEEGGFLELPRLSPNMIYYLARRYDEFEGEEDLGSSLRGAFKGWFHHGLCYEADWPDLAFAADLDDPDFKHKCRQHPLGAYYRINPFRLDDMQSAICELDAIAVSAAIHDGWKKPVVMVGENGEELHVIARSSRPKLLGGHAFIIVGYNRIGFLVQNSWGRAWGKNGFATLPYEDWLDSAYDAWVARPGVPQTPFYTGRAVSFDGTRGALVLAKGPNIERLNRHIVNLGNNGRFSTSGKIRSSSLQVERIFENMESQHQTWQEEHSCRKRHIVLYAHGGLVSEGAALAGAQASLNWWLNNRVYPIFFAWQTGASETLLNQIFDIMQARLPAGGLGFDLEEQFDRLVEKLVRQNFTWAWNQMKGNARAASEPLRDGALWDWAPGQLPEEKILRAPGASLVAARLARYIRKHGAENVAVHLVGHSAGSIFHAALLERLEEAGVQVESLAFLAPGLRADEFAREVYPRLGSLVKHTTIFVLGDSLEQEDSCGQGGVTVYHKSLLYLVSRALEKPPKPKQVETPLVGLERSYETRLEALGGATLLDALQAAGGALVVSRSQAPADLRCEAVTHGAFDNDPATMTSVLLRAFGLPDFRSEHIFHENSALLERKPTLAVDLAPEMPAGLQPALAASRTPMRAAAALFEEALPAGAGGAQGPEAAPPPAPEDSPILQILKDHGYRPRA